MACSRPIPGSPFLFNLAPASTMHLNLRQLCIGRGRHSKKYRSDQLLARVRMGEYCFIAIALIATDREASPKRFCNESMSSEWKQDRKWKSKDKKLETKKRIYIYIYIYMCVCVCVCVSMYIINKYIYIYIYIVGRRDSSLMTKPWWKQPLSKLIPKSKQQLNYL